MRRTSNKKNRRGYQIKKRGVKDDYIDKQITVIHQAIAKKLLCQPKLVTEVQSRLDNKREEGTLGYGAYITWTSILELYNDKQAFLDGMLAQSSQMKRLRRSTPFVGILTEEERRTALEAEAISTIDNTDVLFL